VLFSVLGIVNGSRQQILATISILTCGGTTLYFQGPIIEYITRYIAQDPTINFLMLIGLFFLMYFILKNIITALIFQNKSPQKSSWTGHLLGALFGIMNCWLITFALTAMAANHSHTRSTAHDIFNHSVFLSQPYYIISSIGNWRPTKSVSRKLTRTEPPSES